MSADDAPATNYGLGLDEIRVAEPSADQLVSQAGRMSLAGEGQVLAEVPTTEPFKLLQRPISQPDVEALESKEVDLVLDDRSETSSISIRIDDSSFGQYGHMSTPATSLNASVSLPSMTPRPPSEAQSSHPYHQVAPFAQPPVHPLFYPYPVAPLAYYPPSAAPPRLDGTATAGSGDAWHVQGQAPPPTAPWAMAVPQPLMCYDQNGMLIPYYPPSMFARPPPQQAQQPQAQPQQQPSHAQAPNAPPLAWPTQLYAPLPGAQMWMSMGAPGGAAGLDGQSQLSHLSGAMPSQQQHQQHIARSQQQAMQQFAAAAAARGVQVNAGKPIFRPPTMPSTPRQMRAHSVGLGVDSSPAAYLPAYAEHSFAAGGPLPQQPPPPPPPPFAPGMSAQQPQQPQGRFLQGAGPPPQHW